jgi:hypothetical protein
MGVMTLEQPELNPTWLAVQVCALPVTIISKCPKCETINTITLEMGELKKQV